MDPKRLQARMGRFGKRGGFLVGASMLIHSLWISSSGWRECVVRSKNMLRILSRNVRTLQQYRRASSV
jgi:hypothetical protein